jgi:hypothetical protein
MVVAYSDSNSDNKKWLQESEALKKKIDAAHLKMVEAELNGNEVLIKKYAKLEDDLKARLVQHELAEAFGGREDRFKVVGQQIRKIDKDAEEAQDALVAEEIGRKTALFRGRQKDVKSLAGQIQSQDKAGLENKISELRKRYDRYLKKGYSEADLQVIKDEIKEIEGKLGKVDQTTESPWDIN